MSKASRKRPCPAVGRPIAAAECGENRVSRYACPPDCPFNPFAPANYDQLLELEAEVDQRALDWLHGDTPDPSALEEEVQRALASPHPHASHARIVWRLFYEADAAGRTCAQRWEAVGYPGLKNDGRTLMRGKLGVRVALLETHRVLDAERIEAVDLLDATPQPFILRDRGFASGAVRFGTALTWVYRLPHFHRLHGTALLLQEVGEFEPREVVEEVVKHLGGPAGELPLRRWLAEHFLRFEDALTAVAPERRRQMFANVDAGYGTATYRLERPLHECLAVLAAVPLVEKEEPAESERKEGFTDGWVWFEAPAEGEAKLGLVPGAQAVLGRVLLRGQEWRVMAMGKARFELMRARFEECLGDRVRFVEAGLDDFASRIALKDPPADRSLVPPRLLDHPTRIAVSSSRLPVSMGGDTPGPARGRTLALLDREFLDYPVPALDGLTPRAAAADPAARSKLVRLMKGRIRACDERNLESGDDYDCNWMLRELGLMELVFDPPPPGRIPRVGAVGKAGEHVDNDFEPDETLALPMDPALPPAPPLPERPFTAEEVIERLEAASEPYSDMAQAVERLGRQGCTLIEDVAGITKGLLNDGTVVLLLPLLLQVWHVFAPPGTRAENLSVRDLRESILRHGEALTAVLRERTPEGFEGLMEASAQPVLLEIMSEQLLHLTGGLPKKSRPSPEQHGVLLMVLQAVIEQLDRVHRGG